MLPRRSPRPLPTKPAPPAWKRALPALLAAGAVWAGWQELTRPRNPALAEAARTRTTAQDWAALAAFGPRPVGTPGHDRAVDWLDTQFTALGYHVTRQEATATRPFDQGGTLKAAGFTLPVKAIYGAAGGEQTARLVRVDPDATPDVMEAQGLRAQLALTTCPSGSWRDLAERVNRAGGFGLLLIDDCPSRALQRVDATPFPLVTVPAGEKARVLALAGQTVTLTSRVETRPVTGHNLIVRRVNATPDLLYGAHLDTVNGSPGGNDNSSGVLTVLNLARQHAGTPTADRVWFVLFDLEEDGLIGSRLFVKTHSAKLRPLRAMLNFDMVGVPATPLKIAGDVDVIRTAQTAVPGLGAFTEDPPGGVQDFGRSGYLTGRSDHVPFKGLRIRTLFFHRGLDAHYHTPQDTRPDLALVQDTADKAARISAALLDQPFRPSESCGIQQRNCRF